MDMPVLLTDRQRRMAGRITARRWAYSYKAGMSARAAAQDTLIFLSLFGYQYFMEAVNVLRSRNLIRRNTDVIYGGWLCIGMRTAPNISHIGRVLEQEIGHLEPRYQVQIEPAFRDVSQDTMRFMAEVRDMIPDVEPGDELPQTADLKHEELGRVLKEGQDAFCAVCYEDFGEDEVVVVLECGHWFCVSCMDAWLGAMNDTCPLCRRKVERHFDEFELPYYYDGDEEFDYDADDERET